MRLTPAFVSGIARYRPDTTKTHTKNSINATNTQSYTHRAQLTVQTEPSETNMSSIVVLKSVILAVTAFFLAMPSACQGSGNGKGNWDILYQSALTDDSNGDVTLDYRIGSGREYEVDLFERDCVVPIPGVPFVVSRTFEVTASEHDGLRIALDLDQSAFESRNVWEGGEQGRGGKLQFCVRVRLVSVGSINGEEEVIKEE